MGLFFTANYLPGLPGLPVPGLPVPGFPVPGLPVPGFIAMLILLKVKLSNPKWEHKLYNYRDSRSRHFNFS